MPAPRTTRSRPVRQPFPAPLARAVFAAFVGTTLALPLQPAQAQTSAQAGTEARHGFDIPAGPLDQALSRFGRQAGVQIVVNAELTAGLRSTGVSGSHTEAAALRQLLAGTGLEAQRAANGEYTLRRAPAAETTLKAVNVNARVDAATTTEGTGSYTTSAMQTATKLPMSIRETPQSVSVVTRQRIEDQNLTTLGDIAQAVTGFFVTKWGGERYRFTSRGFQVNNLMIDGLAIDYEEAALSTGAMSMYDRVEVMRGAAGLMEGAGTPGGSINLVRKRPTSEFQGSLTGSVGSWDNYMGSVDVGGPLNEAGTLRARAVLSYQDKHSFIDDYRNKRSLFYGVVEADLTPATTLTLGASYSKEDNPGVDWNGIATYGDGSFLPISRSSRTSPSWSYWDKESTTVFAELEHRFANGWKGKLAASSIESRMDMMGTYVRSSTLDANGDPLLTLGGGAYEYERDQQSFDAYLSGPFSLFGRTHTLAVGASHRQSKYYDRGAAMTLNGNFGFASFNPLNWDPSSIPVPSIGAFGLWEKEQKMEQSGLYGSARFSLSDPLSLILGARVDWYHLDGVQYDNGTPYSPVDYKATRKVTPYAGVVYDLDDTYSVYASWTQIFNPQNYSTANGSLLDPQEGSNYEAGVKAEYFGGRLNASAAVFQIDLENLPDRLPASACSTGLTACYRSAGKVRSRGVELEVGGELTPGWQLSAGYTYTSARRMSDASAYDPTGTYTSGKRYATNIPRHLFKLATTYRLPGELQRWKIGGSLHAQNEIYSPWGVRQGGYTVVGLHGGYTVNKQLEFGLSINNLFDRHYYAVVGGWDGSNFVGDPLNATLTAKYSF